MSKSTTVAPLGTAHAGVALRVLVAVGLAVSAYLHYDLAQGPMVSGGKVTLAGLFITQAVVAAVVALWVLARGDWLSLLAAAVVALGSFAALVFTTYVKVSSIGPMPAIYDPSWYTDKVVAAVAAGLAGVVALIGLLQARRQRS